jgi:hypothetical protein
MPVRRANGGCIRLQSGGRVRNHPTKAGFVSRGRNRRRRSSRRRAGRSGRGNGDWPAALATPRGPAGTFLGRGYLEPTRRTGKSQHGAFLFGSIGYVPRDCMHSPRARRIGKCTNMETEKSFRCCRCWLYSRAMFRFRQALLQRKKPSRKRPRRIMRIHRAPFRLVVPFAAGEARQAAAWLRIFSDRAKMALLASSSSLWSVSMSRTVSQLNCSSSAAFRRVNSW